jgi:hypothetical protein
LPTVAELAQQELSRRYSLQGRTQVAPRVQTMQNARPTVRSALSNLMRDAVDATGLEGGYRQGLLNAAGGVETAVDFLPVVGDALAVEDASRAYGQGDMVGAGINMMGVVPVFGDVAAKGARSALRVRPPSDNITNVRNANFQYPKTIGDETVNINSITGNLRVDQQEQNRINRLADQISSPEGYISRIIVDQNNNVIEGQHRLEALRQLGAKEVPVYKIEELADTMPVRKMEEAINTVGNIHSDHVNQIMQYALDNIAEEGVQGARNFDFGNFQKYYDAALNAVEDGESAFVGDVAAKGAKTARSALRNVIPVGHASPHRFEQFSMDKIGTGEGAQVYGHGLYFAENPTVVDEYFKQFNSPVLRFKEKNVDTPYTAELRDRFKDVYEGLIDDDLTQQWKLNVLDAASDAGLNTDEVADKLDVLIKNVFAGSETVRDFSFMKWDKLGIDPNEVYDLANNQLSLDNVLGGISQAKTMDDLQYVVESYSPDEMRLYKNLVEPELAEIRDSASRYDVNLNVSPEELLDWDAPLSEQSEKVQNALGRNDKWTTGQSLYHLKSGAIDDQLNEKSGELYDFIQSHPKFNAEKRNFSSGEVISSWLNSKGVSGIKYYDGFSRNAKEGTRNYVIFDDSLIDTKRVNDQLTPSWMNPEARMQRAQDLGFDTDNVFYHGTSSDFAELQPSSVGDLGGGVYVTPNPEKASGYAAVRKFMKRQTNNAGPNVLPLRVKSNLNYLDLEGSSIMPFDEARIQSLKDQGYEGIRQFDADGNVIQMNVFDPKNIRSTNAEFDPTKADSADLLSSVGATSALRGIV